MNQDVAGYLSKLLNKPIIEDIDIVLSSAQRARFHGWLTQNLINFDEEVLVNKFKITNLVKIGAPTSVSAKSQISSESMATGKIGAGIFGIDIQKIDELFPDGLPNDPKSDGGLKTIFSLNELSYAQAKINPLQTLTGIYCAKEAIQKASLNKLDLVDIKIEYSENGMPINSDYFVSISHSAEYAIAIAVSLQDYKDQIKTPSTLMDETEKNLEKAIAKNSRLTQNFRFIDFIYIILFIFIGLLLIENIVLKKY